ncbi:unnamed protein product [Thelazia callipaeda]|uniref:Transmembrane protein n=1 Tax=Thelazia callipaeda TaxID=103827 RepID=A0A0N5CWV8_THECL|nr:unnamed protein product [Thelazia callipaeda]
MNYPVIGTSTVQHYRLNLPQILLAVQTICSILLYSSLFAALRLLIMGSFLATKRMSVGSTEAEKLIDFVPELLLARPCPNYNEKWNVH